MGLGRVGAIVGPLVIGLLVSRGWQIGDTFAALGIPALCAALFTKLIAINRPTGQPIALLRPRARSFDRTHPTNEMRFVTHALGDKGIAECLPIGNNETHDQWKSSDDN